MASTIPRTTLCPPAVRRVVAAPATSQTNGTHARSPPVPARRASWLALLRAELAAASRGRFVMFGVGLLLAFLTLLGGTVGTGPGAPSEFLWPAYLVGPLLLIPITAVGVANARHSRFFHGVFTSPVTASHYFWARWTVAALLGVAYLTALVPFVIVQALHGAVDPEWPSHMAAGLASVAYAASLGMLLGVMFTARGTLVTLTTSVGAMILSTLAMVFGPDASVTPALVRRILHASGSVLIQDALHIGSWKSKAPAEASVAYALLVLGTLALAWWIFARHQSPEGWEASRGRALLVGALLVGILVLPTAIASDRYDNRPYHYGWSTSSGGGIHVRLLARDEPMPTAVRSWYEPERILNGPPNHVDLAVFLLSPPEAGDRFRNLSILVEATNLTVTPRFTMIADTGPLPKAAPYGDPASQWPYVRIPVTLQTASLVTLTENAHHLTVSASYTGADGLPYGGDAMMYLESEVPHGRPQMFAAGAVAPVACLASGVARRLRMR